MTRGQPESELLDPCRGWLESYLNSAYPKSTITVLPDTQQKQLRAVLSAAELTEHFPECSAWEVKVDVAGVVQRRSGVHLAFVELKVPAISLADVGQLLGYCRVCRPTDAFLLSAGGISSDLTRLLTVYGRLDVLDFDGRSMQVGRWDKDRCQPDWSSLIPGGLLASVGP
jgi:hypothetical protein